MLDKNSLDGARINGVTLLNALIESSIDPRAAEEVIKTKAEEAHKKMNGEGALPSVATQQYIPSSYIVGAELGSAIAKKIGDVAPLVAELRSVKHPLSEAFANALERAALVMDGQAVDDNNKEKFNQALLIACKKNNLMPYQLFNVATAALNVTKNPTDQTKALLNHVIAIPEVTQALADVKALEHLGEVVRAHAPEMKSSDGMTTLSQLQLLMDHIKHVSSAPSIERPLLKIDDKAPRSLEGVFAQRLNKSRENFPVHDTTTLNALGALEMAVGLAHSVASRGKATDGQYYALVHVVDAGAMLPEEQSLPKDVLNSLPREQHVGVTCNNFMPSSHSIMQRVHDAIEPALGGFEIRYMARGGLPGQDRTVTMTLTPVASDTKAMKTENISALLKGAGLEVSGSKQEGKKFEVTLLWEDVERFDKDKYPDKHPKNPIARFALGVHDVVANALAASTAFVTVPANALLNAIASEHHTAHGFVTMQDVEAIRQQGHLVEALLGEEKHNRRGLDEYSQVAKRLEEAAKSLEDKISKGENVDLAEFKKDLGDVAANRGRTARGTMNLLDFGASVAELMMDKHGENVDPVFFTMQASYIDKHQGMLHIRPEGLMDAAKEVINKADTTIATIANTEQVRANALTQLTGK